MSFKISGFFITDIAETNTQQNSTVIIYPLLSKIVSRQYNKITILFKKICIYSSLELGKSAFVRVGINIWKGNKEG